MHFKTGREMITSLKEETDTGVLKLRSVGDNPEDFYHPVCDFHVHAKDLEMEVYAPYLKAIPNGEVISVTDYLLNSM